MQKKSNLFVSISYAYILLPFLLFAGGWMKPFISIPCIALLLFCYWKICKEPLELWFPVWNRDTFIKMFFVIAIIAIWIYYSGIGKFVFQNTDHSTRNAIFNILVQNKWPVINYDILPKNKGLIYYIGFWLPPAVLGKLFGLRIGYYAQAVWALVGIFLVYYLICAHLRRIAVWPLAVLIFFSGLDIVGVFLTNFDITILESKWHLEWWSIPYEYSSMTTQLFWTFNQSIPAWLCTMLLYMQKNNRNLIFILACSMLTSSFPFVGLLLLSVFFCFTRKYDLTGNFKQNTFTRAKNYFRYFIPDTCTVQNILGGGVIGIISFIYLSSNYSGGRIMGENIRGPMFDNSLAKFVLFLILEVGVYCVVLYKYNQKNKLFYFIMLCLCIMPPIKVGYSNDFCMRASIPALFLLMILVIETIDKSWKKKDYGIFISLIIALVIGSATPICEMKRTFSMTYERIANDEIVYSEDDDEIDIMNSPNFSGDTEKSIFFKYFAK